MTALGRAKVGMGACRYLCFAGLLALSLLPGCSLPGSSTASTPQHRVDTAISNLIQQKEFTLTESFAYLDNSDATGTLTLSYNRPDRYSLEEHLLSPTQRPYLLGSWARVGKDLCRELNNDKDTYLCSEVAARDLREMIHDILLPRGAAVSSLADADPASNGLLHEAFTQPHPKHASSSARPSVVDVRATGYPWPCNPLITCTGQSLDHIRYAAELTLDPRTGLPRDFDATAQPGPDQVLSTGDVQDISFRYATTLHVTLPSGKRVTCPFPQSGTKQWCIRTGG